MSEYNRNAVKHGFDAKPLPGFEKLYREKINEYTAFCKDEVIVRKCALTFTQLKQAESYCLEAGKRIRKSKWRAKKNLLKKLEIRIKGLGTPTGAEGGTQTGKEKGTQTKEKEEYITVRGATYKIDALTPEQFERLKEKQAEDEARKERGRSQVEATNKGTPTEHDGWELEDE